MAYFEYDGGTTGEYITSTGEAPGTNRLEIACDMGKVVVENNKITFIKNAVSEREFNKTNKKPFGCPENSLCEIETDTSGGEEGINGLTISNSIHLSAWTGEIIDVKNFPHERFYELLQEHVKASKPKKNVKKVVSEI